jgi:hypothetical protein
LRETFQLIGWPECARQSLRQGVGVCVDDPLHESDESLPRIIVVGERILGGIDVLLEAERGKSSKQLPLAWIATIQSSYTDAGVSSHRRNRCFGIGHEDGFGGFKDEVVVPGRLCLSAAPTDLISRHVENITEQSVLF